MQKKNRKPKSLPAGRERRRPDAREFVAEQRVKVILPGSFAQGREGVVRGMSAGNVVVQLDGKQIAHEFAPADLAAV